MPSPQTCGIKLYKAKLSKKNKKKIQPKKNIRYLFCHSIHAAYGGVGDLRCICDWNIFWNLIMLCFSNQEDLMLKRKILRLCDVYFLPL